MKRKGYTIVHNDPPVCYAKGSRGIPCDNNFGLWHFAVVDSAEFLVTLSQDRDKEIINQFIDNHIFAKWFQERIEPRIAAREILVSQKLKEIKKKKKKEKAKKNKEEG